MKTFGSLKDLRALVSSDWRTLCDDAISATIILTTDAKTQKVGAFKMSSFGTVSPAIFGTFNHNICAKQSYYATQGLQIAGTNRVATQNIAHDFQRQVRLVYLPCLISLINQSYRRLRC